MAKKIQTHQGVIDIRKARENFEAAKSIRALRQAGADPEIVRNDWLRRNPGLMPAV